MGLRTTTRTSTHGGGVVYEDFTTYNETDGPTKVTVTASTITLTAGDRDEDYYVTKDFGANYFGDFTHWVDVNVTSLTNDSTSNAICWGLGESEDDFKDIDDAASEDGLILWAQYSDTPGEYNFTAYDLQSGSLTIIGSVSATINVNTPSYLAISRSGTTVTVEIYSSAALRAAGGSGDVDTITGEANNTALRWVYGLGSYATGSSEKDISATISNLLLVN